MVTADRMGGGTMDNRRLLGAGLAKPLWIASNGYYSGEFQRLTTAYTLWVKREDVCLAGTNP